jgi:hypothetical protein
MPEEWWPHLATGAPVSQHSHPTPRRFYKRLPHIVTVSGHGLPAGDTGVLHAIATLQPEEQYHKCLAAKFLDDSDRSKNTLGLL